MFYNTILVPLDGSDRAESILPHVENLAQYDEARVVFTRVVEPIDKSFVLDPDAPPDYTFDPTHDEAARDYLTTWVEQYRDKGLEADLLLMRGQPVDGIIRAAREADADLIAMTSQGRTGLAQVVYGSTAAGVLNRVRRPLLMVHADDVEAGTEENRRILVPLDGSKHAEAIVPHVEGVANLYDAQVTVMRVVTTGYQTAVLRDVETKAEDPEAHGHILKRLSQEQEVERYERARTYVLGVRDTLRERGIDANAMLMQGKPVEGIVMAADSIDADLIAMTSHGKTGLAQVFYGSVSSGVLNRAKRPLLVIRPELDGAAA